MGTVTEDRYTHRVRCQGGPLDGMLFEVRSPHAAPHSVLLLGLRRQDAVKYLRMAPRKPDAGRGRVDVRAAAAPETVATAG